MSSTAGLVSSSTASNRRRTVIGRITSQYFTADVEVPQDIVDDAPDVVRDPVYVAVTRRLLMAFVVVFRHPSASRSAVSLIADKIPMEGFGLLRQT